MNDLLLTEFNKTALEFVDLYAILEGYLTEESEYYKQNNNVFQYMENSSLLLFFDNNNFNYKYSVEEKRVINGSNDGTGLKMLQLYIENKDKKELFSIDQAVEGGNKNPEENQISIKYKKVIGDILITKKIYFKRLSYKEKIDVLEFEIILCKSLEDKKSFDKELINYNLKLNTLVNDKIDIEQFGSNFFNGIFLDLAKEIEINNGIKESFFDMSELKYDFKNKKLIEMLLNMFSKEKIIHDKEKIKYLINNYHSNIRGGI